MPTKHVHIVTHDCSSRPVATLRPCALSVYFFPDAALEVELEHVCSVVTIVTAKDEHIAIVDNCSVRMARTRPSLLVCRNHSLPFSFGDRVFIEVIYSIKSIVPGEDINVFVAVADSRVPISGRRRF